MRTKDNSLPLENMREDRISKRKLISLSIVYKSTSLTNSQKNIGLYALHHIFKKIIRSLLSLIKITLIISMTEFAAHYPDVMLSVEIISSVWLYISGPRLFTKLRKIAVSSCIIITFQHMKEQHYS